MVPPDGHRLVLDAANALDKNPRFYFILRELWAALCIFQFHSCFIFSLTFLILAHGLESHSLLVSGLSLLNVIVNSPDELRVRVVLRNELFSLGLDSLLSALSEVVDGEDKLSKQLSTFSYLHDDGIQFSITKVIITLTKYKICMN